MPDQISRYPDAPGYRHHAAETSRLAVETAEVGAKTLMPRVEREIRDHGPLSCEEIHTAIAKPGEHLLLTSVRARVCQLRAQGRVVDSGERALGESLRAKVIRWRLSTPAELSLFLARKAAESEHGEVANG